MAWMKRIGPLALGILMLANSCKIYSGNYALDNPVVTQKKVMVRTMRYDLLRYDNRLYKSLQNPDLDIWALYKTDSATISVDQNHKPLGNIVFSDGVYYGADLVSDRNAWMELAPAEIAGIPYNQKEFYKRIVFKNDKIYGVRDAEDIDVMEPLKRNEIVKIAKLNPVLSILTSLVVVPAVTVLTVAYLIDELKNGPDNDSF